MFMPMTVNIKRKRFVVIGGGKIATKRIIKLLKFGALITVISPQISEELKRSEYKIHWIKSTFQIDFIKEADYVIAGTNDKALNSEIRIECNKKNIPCLDLSNGKESDFYLPATIQKDFIQISVSTCGKSPTVTKQLRKEIEKLLNDGWVKRLKEISAIREVLKKQVKVQEEREKILRQIEDLPLEDIILRRKYYEDKDRL